MTFPLTIAKRLNKYMYYDVVVRAKILPIWRPKYKTVTGTSSQARITIFR
jgi:hypothetical protein